MRTPRSPRRPGCSSTVAGCVLALSLASTLAFATETQWWTVDTTEQLLAGRGDGVAVTHDGRLVPVMRWGSAVRFDEPVVMAGDVAPDGTMVVGTGYPAKLYRVAGGSAKELTEVPAAQVTAILARADGSVLVATMSPGVLFRWVGGELTELGRLGDGGLWDLAELDGVVVAAGGPPASLYRVTAEGIERWVELPDTHARCLAPIPGGLAVGTSGKGLILSVDGQGRMALLADSAFTEISDLAAAPDGTLWAVALVGEPAKSDSTSSDSSSGSTTTSSTSIDLDLPKLNGSTASSEVLRLTPEGALLGVHRFAKQVASAIAWDGAGAVVGTGFEGEVWRFVPAGGARLASVDAVQVVGILGDGAALLTQGPGAVLVRQDNGETPPRFRSAAQSFPRPVRFGAVKVWPGNEQDRIRFRTGAAEKPDDTWLPWTQWLPAAGGSVPLPAARSLQWELELASGRGAQVDRVEVAFREVNLPPTLKDVAVEEPGVIYLGSPPPSGPVIDVTHPDFSGIFTVLEPKTTGNGGSAQGKKYWRVGFRTLSWKAEDPNEDPLLHDLALEREDGFVLPVEKRLDSTQLALDTTAVPDGVYRFRVTASDGERNPEAPLSVTASSAWFTIDNTPPEVVLTRSSEQWRVQVRDASSPLTRVEWSRDGERWNVLAPADGVLDGLEESFGFAATGGRHLVVVRAIDAQHNRTVVGAEEE